MHDLKNDLFPHILKGKKKKTNVLMCAVEFLDTVDCCNCLIKFLYRGIESH